MKRLFKMIFSYTDPSLQVEDNEFRKVETPNIRKDIYSHLFFDEDYYEYCGEQVEEFQRCYDDEKEDYKEPQRDCIEAFCKVHNIPLNCCKINGEEVSGAEEDRLLSEEIGENQRFNSIEELSKYYKPFFWAYVYLDIINFDCRDEYYD